MIDGATCGAPWRATAQCGCGGLLGGTREIERLKAGGPGLRRGHAIARAGRRENAAALDERSKSLACGLTRKI
jgi:hypothetical protein